DAIADRGRRSDVEPATVPPPRHRRGHGQPRDGTEGADGPVMNAEPDTDPLARPSSDQHTDVCAKSNSTRVDWLAKDLYRYFASSARKEFLNHYDAAAVSGDMHRTRIVGGGEACRSSRRKVFSVV